ncbi:DUF456 family protein [Oxynema sp. CENA135]|uniref:DUF456 domain-containing protein n=1 Tax=Oxynema sp. CENA135 TaxID=984206 RepID=UPI001909FD9C|nr:DUF456 family protein [Oxynema sp. CENA135]MBK4728391.1 DUF456 family protein [Oxynema sp. CENA135]
MMILYWVLVGVALLGAIGAVIPGLPGSSLIVGAIGVWALVHGLSGVEWALSIAVLVLVASVGIDFLATYLGAKQAGASKWGQIGAIVGLFLGLFGLLPPILPFGGLFGLLIGPLLGAIIGEYLYCRDLKFAVKAGVAVVVSSLIGNIIQGVLALAAVVVFLVSTWPY